MLIWGKFSNFTEGTEEDASIDQTFHLRDLNLTYCHRDNEMLFPAEDFSKKKKRNKTGENYGLKLFVSASNWPNLRPRRDAFCRVLDC